MLNAARHLAAVLMGGAILAGPTPAMADFAAGMAAARQGNFATALAEWAPLAEAGDRDAQANLAMMYERGAGVTLDEAVAFEWFLLAARQGHAYAAYKAGLAYQLGHGTETNKPQAVQWFASSAEVGYPGGIYEMGYAYQMGEGVGADAGQALMWFYVAATYDWADAIPARNFVERALSLGQIDAAADAADAWIDAHRDVLPTRR